MILFNLLPYRDIREQHERRVFFAYVAIAVVVSVILSWSVNKVLSFYTERQVEKVEFLKSKINALGSNKKDIDDLKSKIITILDNHKIISKTNYDRLNMLDMIREISDMMPYGVYLRNFQTTSSENIDISGVALSNSSVSDLLNNLAKSKLFSVKNLIHTKIIHTKFGIFQDFNIVITVNKIHELDSFDSIHDIFGSKKNKAYHAVGINLPEFGSIGPSPTLNG